jgi:hypothetical protein
MSSVADSLYSGTAAIGEIKATITLVVGIVIVFSMSSSAIYSIVSTPTRSKDTQASVLDSECKQIVTQLNNGKTNTSSECTTGVKYNIDNKDYNQKVITGGTLFRKDDKINIKYNPDNPTDVSYNETSQRTMGFILSCVAILILICIILYYYLITTYKPLAALEGASTTYNMFRHD